MVRTGRVSIRRVSSGRPRFGAARVVLGVAVAAWPLAAIASSPGAEARRPPESETVLATPGAVDPPSVRAARAGVDPGAASLSALHSWYLVASDPSTGAAVVGRAGGDLRVVRTGDEIEALEVVGLRTDGLLLRPEPGTPGLEQVREVWLLRGERPDEPRLRVVWTRDDGAGGPKVSPSAPAGSELPQGAKTVRRTTEGEDPR